MPLNVTLASSLLDLEADQHRYALEAGGRTFKTGIETLDRDLTSSLWRGGDIVGIGSDVSSGLSNKVCVLSPLHMLGAIQSMPIMDQLEASRTRRLVVHVAN